MWIGILCVLVIGVSVTKMTTNFVHSNGVEASSIINVANASAYGAVPAGGAVSDAEVQTEITTAVEETFAEASPETVAETEAMIAAPIAEMTAETAFEPNAVVDEEISADKYPVAGQTSGPGGEMNSGLASPAAVVNGPGAKDPGDKEPGMKDIHDENVITKRIAAVSENAAADHTAVKSPLDPVIEAMPELTEAEEKTPVLTVSDFFKRFETTENSSVKLWENVSADNAAAYHAAAEQERVLWDYELNLIYSEIRNRISDKEAEELKRMEIEWLKERDQHAERAAAKAPVKIAQNQNPSYTRALAEKTKERCYWLVSEYEDILNQNVQNENDGEEEIKK